MTSEERREVRYQRRRRKREEKRKIRIADGDNFEAVYNGNNLYQSYRTSIKNVSFKPSVQKYIIYQPLQTSAIHEKLMNNTYQSPGFNEFDLCERGKLRHIKSTVISERIVQKSLCKNSLIPSILPTLIYDNGATMPKKGYSFCVNRLFHHLRQFIRENGTDGYILLFDFSKFFDRIQHWVVKELISKEITDERLLRLAYHFVDMFGDVGLGLGSEICQILAISSPNKLDHYLKEQKQIKYYARYSDDGYIIHPDKEYLKECLKDIYSICDELGIVLNEKKTQIVKLCHGFTYLQIRVYITPTGKIIKKLSRNNITRRRRTLKKYKKKVDNGQMKLSSVAVSWESWKNYASNFNSYNTVKSMTKLFNKLFKEYGLNDKTYKAFIKG